MDSPTRNVGHLSFVVLNRDRLHRMTLLIKHSTRRNKTRRRATRWTRLDDA